MSVKFRPWFGLGSVRVVKCGAHKQDCFLCRFEARKNESAPIKITFILYSCSLLKAMMEKKKNMLMEILPLS